MEATPHRYRPLTMVSVLLLVLGLVSVGWAVASQQGDPPTPDGSAALSSAPDDASADTPAAPSPADSGDGGQATAAAPSPDAAGATTPSPTQQPAEPTEQAEPVAQEPGVQPLEASEPVAIDIPGIEVTSDLHPLGLNEDGTLQVPSGDLYDQAAWYDGSPTPGEVGPSVIEGHVTSQGSVPSVFFDLGALEPGDTVDVERADGTTATFEVYAVDSFPKDEFPKTAVYGNVDRPELRLITCGGEYDPDARAHVDNIVVFAAMVGSA